MDRTHVTIAVFALLLLLAGCATPDAEVVERPDSGFAADGSYVNGQLLYAFSNARLEGDLLAIDLSVENTKTLELTTSAPEVMLIDGIGREFAPLTPEDAKAEGLAGAMTWEKHLKKGESTKRTYYFPVADTAGAFNLRIITSVGAAPSFMNLGALKGEPVCDVPTMEFSNAAGSRTLGVTEMTVKPSGDRVQLTSLKVFVSRSADFKPWSAYELQVTVGRPGEAAQRSEVRVPLKDVTDFCTTLETIKTPLVIDPRSDFDVRVFLLEDGKAVVTATGVIPKSAE